MKQVSLILDDHMTMKTNSEFYIYYQYLIELKNKCYEEKNISNRR